MVAGIAQGRRVGRAAVNALRALLERQDHVVQEIDGQNDFGEDLYVTFSEDGRTTADVVKVQVKGGISWRRANGYAVPVRQHADTWTDGNVPVLCVVYDPETDGLYWANATDQLRRARHRGMALSSIGISPNAVLDDQSLTSFVAEARRYVGRYRGMHAVRTHLGDMAGVEFEPADHVSHFTNEYGETLIFWQRLGDYFATLLHSDLGWEPQLVAPDLLRFGDGWSALDPDPAPSGGPHGTSGVPTVGDVILSMPEALWLSACFSATRWEREAAEAHSDETDTHGHADIDADFLEGHVLERILDRLEVEPDLMVRSMTPLRSATDIDARILDELGTLESDPDILREAMSLTRRNAGEISYEAMRLVLFYLIECVTVGSPSLPLEDQVSIRWRVPETDGAEAD